MKSNLSKVNIIYFIVLTLFVGLRILFALDVFSGLNGILSDVVSSVLIQIVLMAGVSIGLYSIFKKQSVKKSLNDIGFKKISSKALWLCVAIGVVVFLLNIFVSNFFNGIIEFLGYTAPTSHSADAVSYDSFLLFLLEVFLVAVLPAVCEEIMHRGILLKTYNKELGTKRAIIFSSLMFGLMHLNIQQFFYATILGVVMAIICLMADSIWPSIIVHFMNNFISVYITFAQANNLPFGNFGNYISNIIDKIGVVGAFISISLFLFSLITLLFYLIICLFKEVKLKKVNNVLHNLQQSIMDNNNQIVLNENEYEMIGEQLESSLNLKSMLISKPNLETLLPTGEMIKSKKMNFNENIFLYASLFLGALVTIITFVWGML